MHAVVNGTPDATNYCMHGAMVTGPPSISSGNDRRLSFGAPTWQLVEISKHPSYHGTMDMAKAEAKQQGSDNCYLTSYCESTKSYTLSVLERTPNETCIEHFKINMDKEKRHTLYEILGTQEKFCDIFALLE